MLRYKKHLQDNFQVSENEWNRFAEYIQPVNVKKNQFFVKEGKVCRQLGFIAEGVFRYYMHTEDGNEITCYFVSENEFVGDPDSFSTQMPSERNQQALTDCTLFCIPYENMEKILKAIPRFKEIMALIDRGVCMGLLRQRDFLQRGDATTKYQNFIRDYPHILRRVPLGYVASFLGIQQQSLSRLRKQIS